MQVYAIFGKTLRLFMARYIPEVKIDKRQRLSSPSDIETIRMALLGVFFIMLTFFVALVASSTPDEKKTVDLISSLQNTFTEVQPDRITVPPSIPAWLDTPAGEGAAPPLDEMRSLFPQAFSKDTGNWGAIELRFTPDLFHRFLYTDLPLAQRFFAGFGDAQPTEGTEPYTLELNIGVRDRGYEDAQQLLQQTTKELVALGASENRILGGFENTSGDIIISLTPSNRYQGAL